MLSNGLRARVACVDTRILDAAFVGREFDRSLLEELPSGCRPVWRKRRVPHLRLRRPDVQNPLVLEPGEVVTREPFAWRDLQLVAEPAIGVRPGVRPRV
jgi:hypothetical protein